MKLLPPPPSRGISIFAFAAAAMALPLGVIAQQPGAPNTSGSDLLTSPTEPKPTVGFMEQDQLTGDWGGIRTALAEHGVTLGAIYTGEVFGNPVGGVKQGTVYDGLLELDLDVDFEKLAKVPGLKFHANAFEIHGASGTDKYVGDFGRFSNIDYYDSFRLFELWLEQDLTIPHLGKLSLRVGQLTSDKEFYGSELAALFINSDFGAPPIVSGNMPVPAYAIAAPGVRLRFEPNDAFYVQAAVFDGNPDPDSLGDPSPGFQPGTTYNHSGTRVNLNSKEGVFTIAEAGFRLNQGAGATGLPGTYKIAGFYHSDTFSDERYDNRGHLLADPLSTGIPRRHSGDYGGYLIIDQALYRPSGPAAPSPKDGKDGKDRNKATAPAAEESAAPSGVLPGKGLAAFLRVSAVPDDRNTISFYLDSGLNYRGLLPGRDKDLLGLAVSYSKFSDSARDFDKDTNFFAGSSGTAPHDEEVVLEASYQAIIAPWWAIQPDIQAIFHPGGSSATDDALVIGLRTVLTF